MHAGLHLVEMRSAADKAEAREEFAGLAGAMPGVCPGGDPRQRRGTPAISASRAALFVLYLCLVVVTMCAALLRYALSPSQETLLKPVAEMLPPGRSARGAVTPGDGDGGESPPPNNERGTDCISAAYNLGSERRNAALRQICEERRHCCCVPGSQSVLPKPWGKMSPLQEAHTRPRPRRRHNVHSGSTYSNKNRRRKKQKRKCKRLLLIVIMNFPYPEHVPFLQFLYGRAFAKVVFYADTGNSAFGVQECAIKAGFYQHRAIGKAMLDYPDFDGYVWTGDDVFLNHHTFLSKLNISQIAMAGDDSAAFWLELARPGCVDSEQWRDSFGRAAASRAFQCLPNLYQDRLVASLGCRACMTKGVSDSGYIPAVFRREFVYLAHVFRDVFFEYAVPTALRMLASPRDIRPLEVIYLWGDDREFAVNSWLASVEFLHPLKLSNAKNKRLALSWLEEAEVDRKKKGISPFAERYCKPCDDVIGEVEAVADLN